MSSGSRPRSAAMSATVLRSSGLSAGLADLEHLDAIPLAVEQMRPRQLLAEGIAKLRVGVNPFLRLRRLIEDVVPRLHVGEAERVAQIDLDHERLAQDLRHAAALDQRLQALERLLRVFGLVRPRRHREPGHRPRAFGEQEVEQLILVVEHLAGAARERDFDRALAEFLEHVGVGLELVAAGEPAGQRLAAKADVLRERGGGKAHRAGRHRLVEQRRDALGLVGRRRPFHRFLAHHEMAKRRERSEKADVDPDAAARGRVHELGKAHPVPGDALA